MEKIFVSACLMGEKVRYDGDDEEINNQIFSGWRNEGRLVFSCPEVEGGLSVPRNPSEIETGKDGSDVLHQGSIIISTGGLDVTAAFTKGANHALAVAQAHSAKIAILKDGSPSCGSQQIYDGSFTGTKKPAAGVTATLLEENGIKVFSENQLTDALAYLQSIEQPIVSGTHAPTQP